MHHREGITGNTVLCRVLLPVPAGPQIQGPEGGGLGEEAMAEQIIELLGSHAVEIDEVAQQCGASPQEISLAILELDLAGRVEILPGGMIARIDM